MSELVWDEAALFAVLNSPSGFVARDLLRRGVAVESAAKVYASGVGGGPHVQTGRLRASITHQLGEDPLGLYVDIGTNVEYAPYVELGHPNTAHVYPRRGGGFGYVSDRPTKAYPFLRPALKAGAI
jgi:phage gpG-like protein